MNELDINDLLKEIEEMENLKEEPKVMEKTLRDLENFDPFESFPKLRNKLK